ncbi:MAG: hypothetical protein N2234_11080, partial [Planctomycetota bacterium]|nr:hypothetical protein [Planctomycetota bacterium]
QMCIRDRPSPQPRGVVEAPKPTPKPVEEPKVDAVAQMALRELEEAKRFKAANPKAYGEILRKFKQIAEQFKGTMAATGAESEYRTVLEELDKIYAEVENTADGLIAQRKFEAAEEALRNFCQEYADTPHSLKATEKIHDANRRWEAISRNTLQTAEKLMSEGKFEEARRLLETESSAHPLLRSQFVTLGEKLAKMEAQQKERETLARYNKESIEFYKSVANVLVKGDIEEMNKEVEAAKKSRPTISEELDLFLKDIGLLASLYKRVMEYLKKESEKGPLTILLASGERLVGRVSDTGVSSFMLNLGSVKGVQGVQMRELSPRFVEFIASDVYSLQEAQERD